MPAPGGRRAPLGALADYARFVKLEHTLFSLPLVLTGALLGAAQLRADGAPPRLDAMRLAWIFLAAAGARTFALAANRWIDREIDARNPRTAARELPSGRIRPAEAWGVLLAGLAVYLVSAAALSALCLALSPIPLLVFVAYPHLKRFTPLCHFGVGAALALSPLGGYLGVTGSMRGLEGVLPLAGFTLLWVAGFDLIYATLDEAHDRAHGIHSLPAAIGARAALTVSSLVQAAAFASLAAWTAARGGGPVAWALLAVAGALLVWQQRAAARVELAFFHINAGLGFVVLALVWSVLG